MPNSTSSTKKAESAEQFNQVRDLILGKDNHLVIEAIKKDARHIVGDVLSEALHDRQNKDGSVNKVLLPLVEDSVENSVTHHSDKLVSSLYPLMGRLVRKSVTAFLTDFMEKTNQLIENSFTIKGLKWRIVAWQSGVSFAQYVASQTFVYRVEHVFLIHRETGLLLKSINIINQSNQDADLISSMLTAINDFVGDSFLTDEDGLKEQLQTVTTDTFNLLIKPGPHALVVAAVIGTPPQKVNDQLQMTLEDIHSLYNDELIQFSGDNEDFENAGNLLQDCLLSEQKNSTTSNKKIPWFAWIFVLIFTAFIAFRLVGSWKNKQLTEKIMQIEHESGIVVKQLKVINSDSIELNILRDPDAVNVGDWLKKNNLAISQINLTEHQYYSLDPEISKIRVQRLLSNYPEITAVTNDKVLFLSGNIGLIKMENLLNQLKINGYNQGVNLNTEGLKLAPSNTLGNSKAIKNQLFNDIVGRISAIQLNFSTASDEITLSMKVKLQRLYNYVEQLNQLAEDVGKNYGLLIMGCSDNSGNKKVNDILSISRAKNTSIVLNDFGLKNELMYVTGLGQINIKNVNATSRKVLFNVIYVNKK